MYSKKMNIGWREGYNLKGFYIEKDTLKNMISRVNSINVSSMGKCPKYDKPIDNSSIGYINPKDINLDTHTCIINFHDKRYLDVVCKYDDLYVVFDYNGQPIYKEDGEVITLIDNDLAIVVGARILELEECVYKIAIEQEKNNEKFL